MPEAPKPSRKPRRLLRRLAWFCGVALLLGLGGLGGIYLLAGRTPSWYVPPGDSVITQWADRALDKLIGMENWASDRHASEIRKDQGTQTPAVVEVSADQEELTVVLTQDEVNSFLTRWYVIYSQQAMGNGVRLADVLHDPMVRLEAKGITLAGRVKSLGDRVVSLEAFPAVEGEGGQLHLKLLAVRSGNLPLPDFAWHKPRAMLIKLLESLALGQRGKAAIDRAGAANAPAVSAALARQGADTLSGKATFNSLFLPISQQSGMAVRLKSCELQHGMITLTTTPLTPGQRRELMQFIQSAK